MGGALPGPAAGLSYCNSQRGELQISAGPAAAAPPAMPRWAGSSCYSILERFITGPEVSARKKLSFVIVLEDEDFLQGCLGWQQGRGGS